MDEMTIRVLASMRTSWARDVCALRHIGCYLEDTLEELSWQGTKILDVSEKIKSAGQMVTEVISVLNEHAEVRGDSIHGNTTPEWEPIDTDT